MGNKPNYQDLKKICPDVPDDLLRAHLERLDQNYFSVFSPERIKDHLECLARLNHGHPIEVLFEDGAGDEVACTVLAYDYPSEFSLITGILSSTGFNILSGNIFTYAHLKGGKNEVPRHTFAELHKSYNAEPTVAKAMVGRLANHPCGKPQGTGPAKARRLIIDRFSGVVRAGQDIDAWKIRFKSAIEEVIGYLENGSGDCMTMARSAVNEMVASCLAGLQLPAE
ncbi:hypothetical protein ACFLQL_04500, partial [Verrucomicrobiota bacterium]